MTIDKAKFRKPVVPGDVVEFHMTKLNNRRNMWWYRGEAKVDGVLVAEAEVSAMLVTRMTVPAASHPSDRDRRAGRRLGADVAIGPFCMVGPDVELGDGVRAGQPRRRRRPHDDRARARASSRSPRSATRRRTCSYQRRADDAARSAPTASSARA